MQGFILINKPKGITSFKAVSTIKHLAREKRVGHTGTLDPIAEGVLPIFIGRPTALSSLILDADKSYTARAKLGITTDSLDITGEVLSSLKPQVSTEELNLAINSFLGESLQLPPMYSAIKKDGVRLYELARKGETVEIEPRKINILDIKLLSFENDEFVFSVTCSKGTYIRSLIRDIGEKLGCGATMTELTRTATSGFDISRCVPLNELNEDNISNYILPEETALLHLKEVSVTLKQAVRFSNGGQLAYDRLKFATFNDGELLRIKYLNSFIGLGIADNQKEQISIKCVINRITENI